jgi:uncharacterized protein YegL
MRKDFTELVFILDKSGSMSGLEQDTIGGFNSLIQKQKKEKGEAVVTTVLFNHMLETKHDRVDLKKVKKLTSTDYTVSGCTSLLDAVGSTISSISATHKQLKDDAPEKTIVIITTDGMENSSKEYTYDMVKKLIDRQKKKNWEFLFLGANIDVAAEARRFGIEEDKAVKFSNDKEGIALNYCCLEEAVSTVRKGKALNATWKQKIEEDYENRK